MAARLSTAVPAPPAVPVAAPVSGWRRVVTDWTVVGGTTALCHVLGAATSLLLRMLLDPAQMGIWQAMKLLLSYGNYASLGASKGAAREFNIALGGGETARAERGLNLAFTVNTVTSLVYAAVLIGVGLWIGAGSGTWSGGWAVGLVTVGGLAVLGRYVTFHVTILRVKQAFWATSQLALVEAVLTLGVCGLAAWRFGLAGLYGGTLVVMLGSLAFVLRRRAVTLGWAWDAREVRRLVAIGGPILLAGATASLFRSLDKLMILGYLSDRAFQLGCYSVALMVTAQLYGLGNMLSMVMAPRYGEKFGRTGDRREVARLAARASELVAAAMALPAALAIAAGMPFLAWLLPDYRPGLAPMVWLVPGAVCMCLALPANQYLVAVRRERRSLAAVLAGLAFGAAGNHVALRGGFGLTGVAVATALGYAAYLAISVAVSFWAELDRGGRWRYVSMLALATVPALGLAIWLGHARASSPVITAIAVTLAWALSAAAGWHLGGWKQELREGEEKSCAKAPRRKE